MLGEDGQLHPSFLNVKHRVCDLALLEDVLVLAKLENRFPGSDFGDKDLRIKLVISWLSHGSLLWLDVINSRWDGGGFRQGRCFPGRPNDINP